MKLRRNQKNSGTHVGLKSGICHSVFCFYEVEVIDIAELQLSELAINLAMRDEIRRIVG